MLLCSPPQLQRHLFDVLLFWLAGRLLCDTYLGARELLREVDYTMTTLARIHLGQNRSDLAAADVAGRPFAPSDMRMRVRKECRQAAARAKIFDCIVRQRHLWSYLQCGCLPDALPP